MFLGRLQGIHHGGVMGDGKQVWWSKGAGIWGWPWWCLERFGDLWGCIPALRPLAGDFYYTTFLASPSPYFLEGSRLLHYFCLIHLSEEPRSFWR